MLPAGRIPAAAVPAAAVPAAALAAGAAAAAAVAAAGGSIQDRVTAAREAAANEIDAVHGTGAERRAAAQAAENVVRAAAAGAAAAVPAARARARARAPPAPAAARMRIGRALLARRGAAPAAVPPGAGPGAGGPGPGTTNSFKIIGIKNLTGNTCYFNSAIQFLNSCPEFNNYLKLKNESIVKNLTENNYFESNFNPQFKLEPLLNSTESIKLLKELSMLTPNLVDVFDKINTKIKESDVLYPTKLLMSTQIVTSKKKMELLEQHDSNELLLQIFDVLDYELSASKIGNQTLIEFFQFNLSTCFYEKNLTNFVVDNMDTKKKAKVDNDTLQMYPYRLQLQVKYNTTDNNNSVNNVSLQYLLNYYLYDVKCTIDNNSIDDIQSTLITKLSYYLVLDTNNTTDESFGNDSKMTYFTKFLSKFDATDKIDDTVISDFNLLIPVYEEIKPLTRPKIKQLYNYKFVCALVNTSEQLTAGHWRALINDKGTLKNVSDDDNITRITNDADFIRQKIFLYKKDTEISASTVTLLTKIKAYVKNFKSINDTILTKYSTIAYMIVQERSFVNEIYTYLDTNFNDNVKSIFDRLNNFIVNNKFSYITSLIFKTYNKLLPVGGGYDNIKISQNNSLNKLLPNDSPKFIEIYEKISGMPGFNLKFKNMIIYFIKTIPIIYMDIVINFFSTINQDLSEATLFESNVLFNEYYTVYSDNVDPNFSFDYTEHIDISKLVNKDNVLINNDEAAINNIKNDANFNGVLDHNIIKKLDDHFNPAIGPALGHNKEDLFRVFEKINCYINSMLILEQFIDIFIDCIDNTIIGKARNKFIEANKLLFSIINLDTRLILTADEIRDVDAAYTETLNEIERGVVSKTALKNAAPSPSNERDILRRAMRDVITVRDLIRAAHGNVLLFTAANPAPVPAPGAAQEETDARTSITAVLNVI